MSEINVQELSTKTGIPEHEIRDALEYPDENTKKLERQLNETNNPHKIEGICEAARRGSALEARALRKLLHITGTPEKVLYVINRSEVHSELRLRAIKKLIFLNRQAVPA